MRSMSATAARTRLAEPTSVTRSGCRAAYIGYAVTETATFRGQLYGRNAG
jgi:hypothetical protein